MTYLPVKDKDHLARDLNTNAIVSFDMDGYNHYIENYKKVYNDTVKLRQLEDDVIGIKNDLKEIKDLLRGLTNEPK